MVLSDRFTGCNGCSIEHIQMSKILFQAALTAPLPPVFSHQSCEIAVLPLHDSTAVLIIIRCSNIHIFVQQ